MTDAPLTCTACDNIFRNRHDLNNHVRGGDQSSVQLKFNNGSVTKIKRDDDTFKCMCGKSLKLPWSIQRHAKNCKGEMRVSEEAEGGDRRMREGDSYTSECLDFNEEVDETSID